MTKKVNKFRIIERLREKFDLSEDQMEEFLLIEKINLMTSVDTLLRTIVLDEVSKDISGGGTNTYYTVPNDKRWTLKQIYWEPTTVNSRVEIANADATPKYTMLQATGTSGFILNAVGMPMEEGWVLRVTGGGGGDTAREMRIIYEEEDAY